MNLKTTFALLILIAAGAGGWYALTLIDNAVAASRTLRFLDNDLSAAQLSRIEIVRPGQPPVVLEKTGNEWTLPGKWPVRGPEVAELVKTLTSLHSRFAPIAAGKDMDLKKYGLGDDALLVKVKAGDKTVAFKIGEEPSDKNRFTRATYLKLDDGDEVVRLGPGIVAALDRPVDYFQQRRLFPVERVAKDEGTGEKVDRIAADKIRVKGPNGEIALSKTADGWLIDSPVKDHADPEKVKSLLAGLMDVWADKFVAGKGKTPEEMGLDKPEFTFAVKRPGGGETTVQVGKISSSKDRMIMKPAPPPQSPFMPPQKPTIQMVKDEYRYAKIPENDQVFEVKADKIADLALPLADIRDARLARFKTDEVTKIEIDVKGKTIVLEKDKDAWRLQKPTAVEAEAGPVRDLLEKLASLEAKGGDVRDDADLKAVGLDAPLAKIALTLDETKKDAKGPRTLVFSLGESAKEKDKVFVKLADWPRVNVVSDDIAKLAQKDALSYRRRKLFDAANDVTKIQVSKGGESFAFEKKDGVWSQTAPSPVKLDEAKVERLIDDLTRAEATEFVADAPKAEELDKTYGLAKPAVTVTLSFADAKKSPITLTLGGERPAKDESFARVADGPVFGLAKSLRETLERDALSYRPAQAWQVKADDINELRVKKNGEAFTVVKDGGRWKIVGPFSEFARDEYVTAINDELAALKSEKYVAQIKNDLGKFGLDKPYLEIEVVASPGKKDPLGPPDAKKDEKDKAAEKVAPQVSLLQIGKLDESGKSRYGRIGSGDAVFLIGDKAVEILDRGPLDLLNRVLVKLDSANVTQIRFFGPSAFTLEKGKDGWQIAGSPAPQFKAEDDVADATVRPWGNLFASKIAAYGPKIDWANYGLEKPEAKVVVVATDDMKKPIEHTVSLGKDAGGGSRYVRVDQRQEVAVVDAATAKELTRSYLDYLDPRVLKFAFDAVTQIKRDMKDGDIDLVKRGDAWEIAKPSKQPADAPTIDDIIEKSFRLKAVRFAEYPAKDLAKLGLAPPVATVTFDVGDKNHVIKIGNTVDAKSEERYAIIDDSKAVIVLPAALSKHLTAAPLYFADRNVASFGGADRIELTRGDRKLVFVKAGRDWKLTEPLKADAEEPLDDFVRGLFRLRADEIVAAKGADTKAFGFDPPAAQWKVQSAGKDVLDLQIGGVEKGKDGRRFARIAGSDQVFLLSPKQSVAALGEYRSRKPWPPLDAVQITSVAVGGEGSGFALMKKGQAWTIKDRPSEPLNEKIVTDLLDALASLKAESFIVDAKANLKLFGLDPAAKTIEVTTATGPRTLLIGRTEEGTGRVYAAVAGSDAVFTIAEADARRILRPIGEYLQMR
jgi:hypothetical protein